MINIVDSFEMFEEAAQENKPAYLTGSELSLTPTRGFILPVLLSPTQNDCIYVDEKWKRIELFLAGKRRFNMRWMPPLKEWQNITNLFDGYGMENDPRVNEIAAHYQMYDGYMLPLVANDDYDIHAEKRNGRFYLHCDVYAVKPSILKEVAGFVKRIHGDHGVDNYIYSIKPNKEYVLTSDTTFKFAELVGYKFFETAVLGDGFEHDIYKMERTT